ncbi:ABC transporter ATP-binding protein [Microlunatus parietis]|uniref:ATP-binding cassette subfamily B protein n=1 Tax=Microlunatus parietis TaxID=682979 RepID=A0A7Y9I5A5_9ACTN|nr:ABC transporter ATP-binding protein [Microlunatus parietis]NYE70550.1 ATP-binding cassette subfamily B protein [Microlunatus parietis]
MKTTLRALWLVFATTVRASPLQSLLCLAETASRALSALNPLFYGLFASGAVRQDAAMLLAAVVGLICTTAVRMIFEIIGTSARLRQMDTIGFVFQHRIAKIMGSIETLDHQESPALLDKLQMFRDYAGSLAGALNSILGLINTVVWSATSLIVAITADWRLIILVLLGLPRILLTRMTVRWDQEVEDEGSPHNRRANELVDLCHRVDAGAEIRVFGLAPELRRIIRRSTRQWQLPTIRKAGRYMLVDLINGLVYYGAAAAVLGWMIIDTFAGRVDVQAITIAITALGTLQVMTSNIVGTTKWAAQSIRSATRFVWLQDYARTVHDRFTGDRKPPPKLQIGIRFENVSFRYAGATRNAITDLTLDLAPGQVVALVGENGAGKSTLVKLLTGMYAPTSGRILIDGIDLADLDVTAWRQRCTGAFQDHANFEFTAAETVGLGALDRMEDTDAIKRALYDGAGENVLKALPNGLATQLGTRWPKGIGLSGGQWQRLAIARGMMRRRPLLLALDEPTSALDAATENALFERYAAATRETGRRGGITLLVTHRFSTVAAADTVVVLSNGQIAESGTHTYLLRRQGAYAELYGLQARGYS